MFSGMDKETLRKMSFTIGVIIVFLIVIFVLISVFSGSGSHDKIKQQLKEAGIKYYEDNPDLLPTDNKPEVYVDIVTLSEARLIKPLSELIKKETCTGGVRVQINGSNYLYFPVLNCSSYSTITINSKVMNNNPVTITTDGLYRSGEEYIFRGENLNNYVSFNGELWQIIRINQDGSLRIIQEASINETVWDDRYNVDRNANVGINTYSVSRIKDKLNEIYEGSYFTDASKEKIVLHDICVSKRKITETNSTGSVECKETDKNKALDLLGVYEYISASLDTNCNTVEDASCSNYNYLAAGKKTWSLIGDTDTTHKVFRFTSGRFSLSNASISTGLRLIVHLNGNAEYVSGDGSKTSPYVVK